MFLVKWAYPVPPHIYIYGSQQPRSEGRCFILGDGDEFYFTFYFFFYSSGEPPPKSFGFFIRTPPSPPPNMGGKLFIFI